MVTASVRATRGLGGAEWDADCYHRLCQPQTCWGLHLIQELALRGNETVMDAGCGSGRLTAALLEQVPAGRVLAVDRSGNMLRAAKAHLGAPRRGHVSYLQADLAWLPVRATVDLVFSAATFHWLTDHVQLFQTAWRALKPDGRLVAQCGGGDNIARLRRHLRILYRSRPYRQFFAGWREPWYFTGEDESALRLYAAGFVEVKVSLAPAPFQFPTAAAYREFIRAVLLRAHLENLPATVLRERFLDDLTCLSAQEPQPFALDFWRLNLRGRRPREGERVEAIPTNW